MLMIGNIICLIVIIIFKLFSEIFEENLISYILNIVASSFLTSSIFYLVQSYLPRKSTKRDSLKIIRPILEKLLEELESLIYWFDKLIKVDDSGKIQLYPGDYYFCNSKNIKRNFNVSKDLESNAIEINRLITSLYKTRVLQNLGLNFPLDNLMRYFEEGSSYRNILKFSSYFGKENAVFGDLNKQIFEINEAYILLKKYYNKNLNKKEFNRSFLWYLY